MSSFIKTLLFCLPLFSFLIPPSFSTEKQNSDEIILEEGLALKYAGRFGRHAFKPDLVEYQIIQGSWSPPEEGELFHLFDDRNIKWESISINEEGRFQHRGYVYIPVECDQEQNFILKSKGNNMVYVNEIPRVGDIYRTGWSQLPIQLNAGTNHLLFYSSRGGFEAKLVSPPADVFFNTRDMTLPDFVLGEKQEQQGAVIVVNASAGIQSDLSIKVQQNDQTQHTRNVPELFPLSTRKVPFPMNPPDTDREKDFEYTIQLIDGPEKKVWDEKTLTIRTRKPTSTYKRTFISDIDGSLQYYAVHPATPINETDRSPALFLSLHGASVEAINQANAYAPKSWGTLVAPTNRRPYGFDWEDWGRLDAMEVLDIAVQEYNPDSSRIYLTGHSMGGHGTWQIGAHYPSKFAAIAPSAGWISFISYTGAAEYDNEQSIENIMRRSNSPSDTMALSQNYLQQGVYILHGGNDDNVPPSQARTMAKHLQSFHSHFYYHEEPGVGHWWDKSEARGTDCVDWAPMFDFFARHRIPHSSEIRHVTFVTTNPAISSQSHWVTLMQQEKHLDLSSVSIRLDPWKRRFSGTTKNVGTLRLSVESLSAGDPVHLNLDEQDITEIAWPKEEPNLYLEKKNGAWEVTSKQPAHHKSPKRYGPFKNAFKNNMLFIYGTQGTLLENRWAYYKARYDAETFWYRGNGSVEVIPDTQYIPNLYRNRNIILYGNADTHSAWSSLLSHCPVQIKNGLIQIGEKEMQGEDLSCLMFYPRKNNDFASIGIVSGTGITGMKATDRLPYFVSGVAYPDCTIFTSEVWKDGLEGIQAAGFFGSDWSIEEGDFAWRE